MKLNQTLKREELVLQQRAEGKTLEEVGKIWGVTRERIRQIEAKAKERIRVCKNKLII